MFFLERKSKIAHIILETFKIKDIYSIVVSQFGELSSKVIYQKIEGYYPNIIVYFPEYNENSEYLPPKRFLWNIFTTKDLNIEESLYLILWSKEI